MPSSTPVYGLPHPLGGEGVSGPGAIEALAVATEAALTGLYTGWTSYTPTVAGIAGTATGRSIRLGKLRIVTVTLSATGAATGLITITKPSNSVAGGEVAVGTFNAVDASAGARYTGAVIDGGGSAALFFTSGNNVYMGSPTTSPWTWANGDKITATFSYEEA